MAKLKSGEMGQKEELTEDFKLEQIVKEKGKYKTDAYRFLLTVLGNILLLMKSYGNNEQQIKPEQFLRALKAFGWVFYGMLAPLVFSKWGIKRGKDFSCIVFELIEWGYFNISKGETIKDFEGMDLNFDDPEMWSLVGEENIYNYIHCNDL